MCKQRRKCLDKLKKKKKKTFIFPLQHICLYSAFFGCFHWKCLTLDKSSQPVTASRLQRPWWCNPVSSDLFSSNPACFGRAALDSSSSCSLLLPAPRWDKNTIFICSIQAEESWVSTPSPGRESVSDAHRNKPPLCFPRGLVHTLALCLQLISRLRLIETTNYKLTGKVKRRQGGGAGGAVGQPVAIQGTAAPQPPWGASPPVLEMMN